MVIETLFVLSIIAGTYTASRGYELFKKKSSEPKKTKIDMLLEELQFLDIEYLYNKQETDDYRWTVVRFLGDVYVHIGIGRLSRTSLSLNKTIMIPLSNPQLEKLQEVVMQRISEYILNKTNNALLDSSNKLLQDSCE